MLFTLFVLFGCSVSIPYYDSMNYTDGADRSEFDNNLFYRNDNKTPIADVAAVYIDDPASSEYGYYYLYGTTSGTSIQCYRSKTLEVWEPIGTVFQLDGNGEDTEALYNCYWAPEVVFDRDEGRYYMFFSASEKNKQKCHVLYCAASDNPYGPFTLVHDNSDGREINYIQDNYSLFDLERFALKAESLGMRRNEVNNGYVMTIDAHPFSDPVTGRKYLYFKMDSIDKDFIVGMEMKNWYTPVYDTLSVLAESKLYTPGGEKNPFESRTRVNEGPYMIYRNGVYYLTFSVFGYGQPEYSVYQAVGAGPLEPFRKLTAEEGGIVLSADGGMMDNVSATGHHSIVERDGEYYIVYHAYPSALCEGSRYVAVDKLEWITVTDINGNPLDVMYANGPTKGIQPRFSFNSEYVNIAPDAEISMTNLLEGEAAALNDGLLLINQFVNSAFTQLYVPEVIFEKKTRITLDFKEYRKVRAVMIYNCNIIENIFDEVEKIEFFCRDEKGEYTAEIEGLNYDLKANANIDGTDGIAVYSRPGGAAAKVQPVGVTGQGVSYEGYVSNLSVDREVVALRIAFDKPLYEFDEETQTEIVPDNTAYFQYSIGFTVNGVTHSMDMFRNTTAHNFVFKEYVKTDTNTNENNSTKTMSDKLAFAKALNAGSVYVIIVREGAVYSSYYSLDGVTASPMFTDLTCLDGNDGFISSLFMRNKNPNEGGKTSIKDGVVVRGSTDYNAALAMIKI